MQKQKLYEPELRHEIWVLLAEANYLPRRKLQGHGNGDPVIQLARKLLRKVFKLPTTDFTSGSDDFVQKFRAVVEALRPYRNGMSGEPVRIPIGKIRELSKSTSLIDESDLPF